MGVAIETAIVNMANVRSGQGLLRAAMCFFFLGLVAPGLHAQVGPPPIITTQPASKTVQRGSNVTFSVVAVSGTALRYKWYFNGENAEDGFGSSTASFTITNVHLHDAGKYSVEIKNASGRVVSSNAVLMVVSPPVTLASPRMTASGFSLQVPGVAGASCIIEASTNLTDWTPLFTNNASAGNVTFTDITATNRSFRYYRVVVR
jgi:hypothetical protein